MWFNFLTCLCMAVVVADRKTCQKVQVNNGNIRAECCVFTKETTPKEKLLGLLDPILATEMMLQHEKHQGADILFPGIGPIPEFDPQNPPASSSEVTSQENIDKSTESISTTEKEKGESSNNTGITGKTIVDNRNAIDVPITSCPPGQARSPSGDCIEEY